VDDARPPDAVSNDSLQQPGPAAAVEELRDILFSRYRRRIAELEAELDEVERRLADEEALVEIVSPIIGDAIRRKIRDAREEMVEALYPIIGQAVIRAVSEAMRDLARTVDAQMRTTFSPRLLWRRLQARVRGVSGAEMALREVLPFEVTEVFLIHRESGLLLGHVMRSPDASADSDLIGGMLTAIRDFAQDAFGRGEEGQLDEIQYGGRRILIEAAQYAYLAVVVDGNEPPGFRAEMRDRIIAISHMHEETLEDYDGDPAALAPVEASLRSLISLGRPHEVSASQKRVLVAVVGLLGVCLLTLCLAGGWGWQALRSTPTRLPVTMDLTPTFTVTPSPTLTPTPSPTLMPTPTPSPTPTASPKPLPRRAPHRPLRPSPRRCSER
jgi:hypothetical protein